MIETLDQDEIIDWMLCPCCEKHIIFSEHKVKIEK